MVNVLFCIPYRQRYVTTLTCSGGCLLRLHEVNDLPPSLCNIQLNHTIFCFDARNCTRQHHVYGILILLAVAPRMLGHSQQVSQATSVDPRGSAEQGRQLWLRPHRSRFIGSLIM